MVTNNTKIETRGRPRRDESKSICRHYKIWFSDEDVKTFEEYCSEEGRTPTQQVEMYIKKIIKENKK